MATTIPDEGWSKDDVLARMAEMRTRDVDYHNARAFGLIYPTTPDVDELLLEVGNLTLLENALNPYAFPSLKDMQRDVVKIAGDLLSGGNGHEVGGAMTSGGTESIFLAVKTARQEAREEKGLPMGRGRVVVPRTAHPAFRKACLYLDLEWVQLPMTDDLRTDPDAMLDAITDDTILCVGAAPAYPFGMIDDIPAMAAISAEHGIPFHVDACIGGYVLPWLERLGFPIPPWDFRVPGVTSISADLHKFGYVFKGASTVLHRPKERIRHQVFTFDDWPGGMYGTMGFQGTKGAAPIAAAWAMLHYLGVDGYCRLAGMAMEASQKLQAGVTAMDGVHVWGEPDAVVMAIGSESHDIQAVGDALNAKGWVMDRQLGPSALHLMVSPRHLEVYEEFLADLETSLDEVGETVSTTKATYGDDVSEEAAGRQA